MDVFQLRNQLTQDYANYANSFIQIKDKRIQDKVLQSLDEGIFWPAPLIQLNPNFAAGGTVEELVKSGFLHPECQQIFRKNKAKGMGQGLRFHRHQRESFEIARQGYNYVLTTGTGSGKSLSYIVPIVDHILRRGSGKGIQAIIVYPMNALANSQIGELNKFLKDGYPEGQSPLTYARYTGQENETERQNIINHPPDILLTNYVMLELLMTRPREKMLIEKAKGLRFLVLDELHTYRGRQGADVALLVRRVRNRLETSEQSLLTVGTSATLASEGSYSEQRRQVAEVASQLFGAEVLPEHVIGETLQPATTEALDETALRQVLQDKSRLQPPSDYASFVAHPLSIWIERTLGIAQEEGRWKRQKPRSIRGENGAAQVLSQLTGADEAFCAERIQDWLLAGYHTEAHPVTGFAPFAFRLHQFISPGDTVYSSLQNEEQRYISLRGQQFVPNEREQLLFPLCFCRECGQEYYSVRRIESSSSSHFISRDFSDRLSDQEGEAGYLYLSTSKPWPQDFDEQAELLPDDWLEDHKGKRRVKPHRRPNLPQSYSLAPNGEEDQEGETVVFIPVPFPFCLNCGVSYSARQGDFGKLATLSSEGRSSATTILSLSAIRSLRESDLAPYAKKLLSFTDNRQDASLQAGHFNDFIEVSLLRGAIYHAVKNAGTDGLSHELIAEKVFDTLNLPIELYASDPSVRFQALQETQRALRQVLGYRIYRDLRRGWRIALPNLEQCGLLEIAYNDLAAVCEAEDVWEATHPALATASPQTRYRIAKVLLDYMRRELAIKVDYLEQNYQERLQQLSSQRLIDPWAIDEDERMEYASILVPRSSAGEDTKNNTYLSARGGFGMFLRRNRTFPEYDKEQFGGLDLGTIQAIIRELLEGLRVAGLVEIVAPARSENEVDGYQLVASAMRWLAGEGSRSFHDPIRVPNESEEGGRVNPFFVDFYQEIAASLQGLEAREHTAQVPYDEREKREEAFRRADLPILYCSPTMELGVDIAELNVVNMRNVPPTPANYAQRSGRAGRSGQPALVFTYCSSGSPHDQYFFNRPENMVAGAVAAPRLDLTNEDLLRAHIHAIWLAETGIELKNSLKEILDMNGEPPSLALLPNIREQAESDTARRNAFRRAEAILASINGLEDAQTLLEMSLQNVVRAFDETCNRWRNLYWSALQQVKLQENIRRDPTRQSFDKKQAERLRRDALNQIDLLTDIESLAQSDFYSYRYFATEGFLPGYSFPRLPISAYIPARRIKQQSEFLSRPRFLAIAEFGPRAILYHEGSRYIINQVIMPVTDSEDGPLTRQIKQCNNCGYVHPLDAGRNYDLCERCGNPLEALFSSMLLMENVVTKRRDRINADEEERLRLGYEIRTGLRFKQRDGQLELRTATIEHEGETIAQLSYAQTATLWRINLGWARRKEKHLHGFILDIERGYWSRNEQASEQEDPKDELSERSRRVIPYVEDKRNCLLFEPTEALSVEQMASLQAALKRAIETVFQLEDNELAAEPMPDSDNRRLLLFYEAAEGGAGVLRRLVDEPDALARVAREALRICHFNPATGEDLHHAPRARENCEAACYDCLLSYGNQREHAILDRQTILNILGKLAHSQVSSSPSASSRGGHYESLRQACESDLERQWLAFLYQNAYRLPDKSQVYLEDCQTRPDFLYATAGIYAAIYIDGSHHDYPERLKRDKQQSECMEDYGFKVLRFAYTDNWDAIVKANPSIFGAES